MKLGLIESPDKLQQKISVDNRGGLLALIDKSGMVIFADQPATFEEVKQIVTVCDNYDLFAKTLKP